MRALAVLVGLLVLLTALRSALGDALELRNVHTGDRLILTEMSPLGLEDADWRRANRVFRSRKTGRRHPIHPRLLRVLAHLQRRFGRRSMELVSGYRQPANGEALTSYHQLGRAADIRIRGIDNRALLRACRKLPRVGCGFYPNARFVHIDVRDHRGLWVDLSAPGQPRHYVRHPQTWLARHPENRQSHLPLP